MLFYKTRKQRYLTGLIIIMLIYSMFYILFADQPATLLIPRKWRHVIKFITTFTVYLVGTYHLGKHKITWMLYLWHFVHITLLSTITSIGIYDWVFGMVRYQVKEIAASMQEFLISPMLYIAMGILNQRLVLKIQKSIK
ncbi:MAG: hypothetical protein WCJ80_10570 [Bacteroidota bacterium]